MRLSRTFSRRLGVLGVAGATALIASCDTSLSFSPNELLWGFVTVGAQKNAAGDLRTAPTAVFFRGEVSSLPSAAVRPDSCYPAMTYVPPSDNFSGVRYLDAGESLTLSLGSTNNTLPRVSGSGVTTYQLAAGSTFAYRPGDSIVVQVPGANGGYPALELRAKTAEAFTLQPLTPPATGYMQVRWNAATDTNSALIVQLLYAPAGGNGQISREIRCAFRDDGVDSIPLAKFAEWSDAANLKREVVASRLRTLARNINNGAMVFISTYQVPTPGQ